MFGLERAGSVLLGNLNEDKSKFDSRGIADHIRVKQQSGSIVLGKEVVFTDNSKQPSGRTIVMEPRTRNELLAKRKNDQISLLASTQKQLEENDPTITGNFDTNSNRVPMNKAQIAKRVQQKTRL